MRTWLKERRENKGFTQSQVALRSHISRSYYTHIEIGTKTPSVPVAKALGKVLDIDWTIFFETKSNETLHDNQDKEVI